MLPKEVLIEIFKNLPKHDLFAVNLTCTAFRDASDPLLYVHVYADWNDLPLDQFEGRIWLRHLSIKGNSSGEWKQSPRLGDIAEESPHFKRLSIHCTSGSSGWLKYMEPLPIRYLKLEAVGKSLHMFDFEHIRKTLPEVDEIHLQGFNLLPPDEPLISLKKLVLIDCVWEYPMDIYQTAPLKYLSITVTPKRQAFAYSERLQHDANNPPDSLEVLHLHLDISQNVGWKPLAKIPKNLKEVSLRGFEPFARAVSRSLPEMCYLIESPSKRRKIQ